jgi:hypothetical protein
MNQSDKIEFGMIGVKSAKPHKVLTEKENKDKRNKRNEESDLQTLICKWMADQHMLFLSDFAAGLYLTPFLAGIRSLQSCEYKVPDLYIFNQYGCQVIEIKTKESELFLSDGKTLKSEHVQLQYETILKLRSFGIYADFGIGEADIKNMILNRPCYKTILPFRGDTKFSKADKLADIFFTGR